MNKMQTIKFKHVNIGEEFVCDGTKFIKTNHPDHSAMYLENDGCMDKGYLTTSFLWTDEVQVDRPAQFGSLKLGDRFTISQDSIWVKISSHSDFNIFCIEGQDLGIQSYLKSTAQVYLANDFTPQIKS